MRGSFGGEQGWIFSDDRLALYADRRACADLCGAVCERGSEDYSVSDWSLCICYACDFDMDEGSGRACSFSVCISSAGSFLSGIVVSFDCRECGVSANRKKTVSETNLGDCRTSLRSWNLGGICDWGLDSQKFRFLLGHLSGNPRPFNDRDESAILL